MILNTELTLTSPIMACKIYKGKPRQFLKTEDGKILIIKEIWVKHMELAAADLELTFKPSFIRLPEGYDAPVIALNRRTYNREHAEEFESIPKGSTLKVEVMLMEKQLEPEHFAKILQVVGNRYGVSQWGSHFGYGRFTINFIKRQRLDVKLEFNLDV